jgi:hypothetical protein
VLVAFQARVQPASKLLKLVPGPARIVRNESASEFKDAARAWAGQADVTVQAEDPESAAALFAQVRGALGLHW